MSNLIDLFGAILLISLPFIAIFIIVFLMFLAWDTYKNVQLILDYVKRMNNAWYILNDFMEEHFQDEYTDIADQEVVFDFVPDESRKKYDDDDDGIPVYAIPQ